MCIVNPRFPRQYVIYPIYLAVTNVLSHWLSTIGALQAQTCELRAVKPLFSVQSISVAFEIFSFPWQLCMDRTRVRKGLHNA